MNSLQARSNENHQTIKLCSASMYFEYVVHTFTHTHMCANNKLANYAFILRS